MKLLVVEDEYDLNNILCRHLMKNGYGVDSCSNGVEALEYMQVTVYDAIILDIMMPIMDGYEFLNRIRSNHDQTPVILLTARDSLQDKILGLDSGADDYLVKPFEPEELLARIRVMTRRVYGQASNEIRVGDLILDISKKKVVRLGVEINLTSKEYEILEYLMQNQDHILSRQQIQDHVWDFSYEGASNMIDVYINSLRKKVDKDFPNKLLHTIRGVGYVLKKD